MYNKHIFAYLDANALKKGVIVATRFTAQEKRESSKERAA